MTCKYKLELTKQKSVVVYVFHRRTMYYYTRMRWNIRCNLEGCSLNLSLQHRNTTEKITQKLRRSCRSSYDWPFFVSETPVVGSSGTVGSPDLDETSVGLVARLSRHEHIHVTIRAHVRPSTHIHTHDGWWWWWTILTLSLIHISEPTRPY